MNHTYRLVWNDRVGAYVAAAESARGKTKSNGLKLASAAVLSALAFTAHALPTGGQISAGAGSIAQIGTTMTVNQSSQNLAVNWQSFSVGPSETVNFHQPNSGAIALNRVLGSDGSQILGKINANGQVWILNPNGVLFGKGAQVNVGGLVASTLGMSDAAFLAGKGTFSGNGGAVTNQGKINAGYVALLGGQVKNEGTIVADLGTVALAAGKQVTLDFDGDKLLSVQVDKSALHALAENRNLIQADGGLVVMTAQAKDALLGTAVNNTGVVRARTLENRSGKILLLGDMQRGTVNVGGTLDASAPNGGNGGFIETSAARVKVADGAKVTTRAPKGKSGTWLIDPVDFTIAAGSGALTTSGIGASTLSTSLGLGNVAIATDAGTAGNGDIFVNSAVSWSANKLTLTAHRNIAINANLNASGTASLALEYGQGAVAAGNTSNYYLSNGAKVNLPAGNNFSTKLGSNGGTTTWTVITALGAAGSVTGTDLQGMGGNLAGNYVLGADINASATSGWNAGAGFAPVGNNITKFTGNFSGLGHTITGLTINRVATDYVGLFGYATGTLRDVGLLNSNISGQFVTGSLAGRSDGSVSYSYADGGSVTGDKNIAGGLLGQSAGSVGYSYASVSVSANSNGVSSTAIGGLVGSVVGGSIGNSYASGSVHGGTDVGGLVGQVAGGATITNAYSTGAVTWSTSGGGLIGLNSGAVTNGYWDTQTSGKATSASGTGLTTAQMQTMASFGGWSIANSGGSTAVWRIYEGHAYPLLRNFLTALTVTANDASKTYNGLAYDGGAGVTGSIPGAVATLFGSPTYIGGINAGSYTLTVDGYWSGQQGYDISYADGALTVNQAPLTVTANNGAKTIDGTAWSGGNGVTYSGFVNGETSAVLGGALAYGGGSQGAVNAGSYAITPSGLTSGNYAISFVDGTLTIANAAPPVPGIPDGYSGAIASLSGGSLDEGDGGSAPAASLLAAADDAMPGIPGFSIHLCGQNVPPGLAENCK